MECRVWEDQQTLLDKKLENACQTVDFLA